MASTNWSVGTSVRVAEDCRERWITGDRLQTSSLKAPQFNATPLCTATRCDENFSRSFAPLLLRRRNPCGVSSVDGGIGGGSGDMGCCSAAAEEEEDDGKKDEEMEPGDNDEEDERLAAAGDANVLPPGRPFRTCAMGGGRIVVGCATEVGDGPRLIKVLSGSTVLDEGGGLALRGFSDRTHGRKMARSRSLPSSV